MLKLIDGKETATGEAKKIFFEVMDYEVFGKPVAFTEENKEAWERPYVHTGRLVSDDREIKQRFEFDSWSKVLKGEELSIIKHKFKSDMEKSHGVEVTDIKWEMEGEK
jgi:hypothetical protein